MKCLECGGKMISRRENYEDKHWGLPHVTLIGVEVRRCKNCGEREVVYPQIEQLHRLMAKAVVEKPNRLMGAEIRFLRKYLGWSGADFARHFGVKPETVSRWENERENMGTVAERLLRLAVVHFAPVDAYTIEKLDDVAKGAPKPIHLQIKMMGKQGWKTKAA